MPNSRAGAARVGDAKGPRSRYLPVQSVGEKSGGAFPTAPREDRGGRRDRYYDHATWRCSLFVFSAFVIFAVVAMLVPTALPTRVSFNATLDAAENDFDAAAFGRSVAAMVVGATPDEVHVVAVPGSVVAQTTIATTNAVAAKGAHYFARSFNQSHIGDYKVLAFEYRDPTL